MASPPDRIEDDDRQRANIAAWMVEYGPALARYFVRKGRKDEAEDLVQEVFLRLQAKAAIEEIENVQGYLFKIAKHVLVNRFEREKHDGLWRYTALNETLAASDDPSPERVVAARQAYSRAVIAILNLPPRTRAVFEFHRFEKLSYAAIADRMGISKGSVQVLMQRALQKLFKEIGRES